MQYKVLGTRGGVSYSWNEAVYQEDGPPGFGMPGYVDAFRYEVEYFVERCVLGGAPPLSTLGDALDALRIGGGGRALGGPWAGGPTALGVSARDGSTRLRTDNLFFVFVAIAESYR